MSITSNPLKRKWLTVEDTSEEEYPEEDALDVDPDDMDDVDLDEEDDLDLLEDCVLRVFSLQKSSIEMMKHLVDALCLLTTPQNLSSHLPTSQKASITNHASDLKSSLEKLKLECTSAQVRLQQLPTSNMCDG